MLLIDQNTYDVTAPNNRAIKKQETANFWSGHYGQCPHNFFRVSNVKGDGASITAIMLIF